jgi:hypothetical protein
MFNEMILFVVFDNGEVACSLVHIAGSSGKDNPSQESAMFSPLSDIYQCKMIFLLGSLVGNVTSITLNFFIVSGVSALMAIMYICPDLPVSISLGLPIQSYKYSILPSSFMVINFS